ncbi:hypothetical protein BJY04DRAFT_208938 [Aspergillus karnatakaensis]|uniref:SDR family NAD(P)-dependent oxidoreductase n=1 Tax=Aspergillus karnatakaensis TaxID=1810916 RepID=UPI003CCD8057
MVVWDLAQGIGAATARLLAQQGAHVILLDINTTKLLEVQSSIIAAGGEATSRPCDLTDETAVTATIDSIVAAHTKIDILAHIAGIYPFHPLENYPTDTYRRAMATNLDSTFFLMRAVMPHMRKAGYGRIIHTSSSTFQEPEVGLSAYAASKAAVIGLVRSAAIEAGPGVTVNVVMPGLVKTETVWNGSVQADGSNPLFESVIAKQIVKRAVLPEDVAHAFCLVASPEAGMFTGQVFDVSGGETFH